MTKSSLRVSARISTIAALGLGGLLALPAWGQKFPNLPISSEQTATAQKVAQAGVPLSELAPDAPDTYVIKSGDTLWAISRMYLRSPWRWPELWGMNIEEILNPHLIYPGQTLYLDKRDGRARLTGTAPGTEAGAAVTTGEGGAPAATSTASTGSSREGSGGIETVRLSPRIRSEAARTPLTTLQTRDIEAFLAEPLIVEENEFQTAPRIVAAGENRVIIGRGDRVYARGPATAPLLDDQQKLKQYRIFRNAKPLKDPDSGEVLGYEAEFLGKAALVRSEGSTEIASADGKVSTALVPATIDITSAKSEMLAGDRMAPEPEREFLSFTPRAPAGAVNGRIVSIYGSNVVANASQNQVVVINRGKRDGIESGHVLAILKDGQQLIDKTDAARPLIKLPNERNGLLMVFRTYEKLSYALILDINDSVRIGDRLASPQ
ncbi:LysM peptidoglycan-binding domain-containing protein [Rhodoferax sp. BAB1]|uniref:LysM peptidoglycan-binding domain-containing protein n=1 Tax=Rhodoferax sp. BAB1 TaxID=2741720 RepID=UPI0015762287|nr:LysM domain-containing protein [Rhodoferax sp. BAB1]QKO23497.1 LysM peptidoglycan-binding domain-containing protein [Rhodoferax sp. BAB1]